MGNELSTYLTFKVKDYLFGINVSKVLEITEYSIPKTMPESMSYISGIIEFREQVVPLIDCGIKLNMSSIDINPLTCIIVLELFNESLSKKYKAAIIVDAVSDVFEAFQDDLMLMQDDYRPAYITASFKSENGLVLILDADKVFNEKDVIAIDQYINDLA
ncbi:MAG: chemotaxis protein CheW [Marinilabiliaceae bacterium]|nr:chemotaxis protein CheW [Marinilabiliaceae bacterium]